MSYSLAYAGSLPFLLKEHLSYSQLAIFSLASYPYSLKLLWSPIVDSLYFPSIGRRKSWIIPMQLTIGSLMLFISLNAEEYMDNVSTAAFYPNTLHQLMSCHAALGAYLFTLCSVHDACNALRNPRYEITHVELWLRTHFCSLDIAVDGTAS